MLRNIDEDEKVVITTNSNPPLNERTVLQANTSYSFLTENGLYEVLMLSRKPKAKEFKKKVKEILKTIRKTGGYVKTGQEDLFVDTYMPFCIPVITLTLSASIRPKIISIISGTSLSFIIKSLTGQNTRSSVKYSCIKSIFVFGCRKFQLEK